MRLGIFHKFEDVAILDHQFFGIFLSHRISSWVFNVSAREHLNVWKNTATCDVTWHYYHQVLTGVGAVNIFIGIDVATGHWPGDCYLSDILTCYLNIQPGWGVNNHLVGDLVPSEC